MSGGLLARGHPIGATRRTGLGMAFGTLEEEAVIAAWLGHTDARFTLAVYTHSTDTALSDAAAVLGRVVAGGGASPGK